jgi:hypothetical protein
LSGGSGISGVMGATTTDSAALVNVVPPGTGTPKFDVVVVVVESKAVWMTSAACWVVDCGCDDVEPLAVASLAVGVCAVCVAPTVVGVAAG